MRDFFLLLALSTAGKDNTPNRPHHCKDPKHLNTQKQKKTPHQKTPHPKIRQQKEKTTHKKITPPPRPLKQEPVPQQTLPDNKNKKNRQEYTPVPKKQNQTNTH